MEQSRGPPRKWSYVEGISRDPTNAARLGFEPKWPPGDGARLHPPKR